MSSFASAAEPSRIVWTNVLVDQLLDAMLEQIWVGCFTDSGFKGAAWNKIVADVNASLSPGKAPVTKQQVQSKHKDLKKKYSVYVWLCSQSGFGMHHLDNVLTAEAQAWDAVLALGTQHRALITEFREHDLYRKDDMEVIFGKRVATGRYAQSSVPPTNATMFAVERSDSSSSDISSIGSESVTEDDGWLWTNNVTTSHDAPQAPARGASSGSGFANKRQRRASQQASIAESLSSLVSRCNELDQALSVFGEQHCEGLSGVQRLAIRQMLVKPGQSLIFLRSSAEDRDLYVQTYKNNAL